MKKQMTGKKGRKKPVVKANVGKFLETFSPAYSVMKGKGPISDAVSKLEGLGLAGAAGKLAREQRKKKGANVPSSQKMQAAPAMGMQGATPLYGGGAVKKKRDGCCIKGKTKGRMR